MKLLILFLLTTISCSAQIGATYQRVNKPMDKAEKIVCQFNFSLTGNPNPVAGWINLVGDPYAAVVTGTDSRSGTTITLRTIANSGNDSVWQWNGAAAAGFVLYAGTSHVWPPELYSGYFFNQNNTYNAGDSMICMSGFDPLKYYRVQILTNRTAGIDDRLTEVRVIQATGTYMQVGNSAPANNAGDILTFTNIRADSNGNFWLAWHKNGAWTFGYGCAVKVSEIPK